MERLMDILKIMKIQVPIVQVIPSSARHMEKCFRKFR